MLKAVNISTCEGTSSRDLPTEDYFGQSRRFSRIGIDFGRQSSALGLDRKKLSLVCSVSSSRAKSERTAAALSAALTQGPYRVLR